MQTRRDGYQLIGLTLAALALGLAFRVWFGTTWLEVAGFVTGAVAVYLVVRQHLWNWPIGILNVGIYALLFYQAKLNGDATLQVLYLGLQIHGWYSWLHGGAEKKALEVRRGTSRQFAILAAVAVAGFFLMHPLLVQLRGASPRMDAVTTTLSLVAQYMLNRKLLENWLVWIVADLIYVPWYWHLGYKPTALLYVVFLILAVAGYVEWRKSLGAPSATSIEA